MPRFFDSQMRSSIAKFASIQPPPSLLDKLDANHFCLDTLGALSIHCPNNTGSSRPNFRCIVRRHAALLLCRSLAKDLEWEKVLGSVMEKAVVLALEMALEMGLVLESCLGNSFAHSCTSAARFLDSTQNSWVHVHHHQTSQPIAHRRPECNWNLHCGIGVHSPC